MTLTRTAGPAGRSLTIRLFDGTAKTVHGRRAAIIRHLLMEATYLDEPSLTAGKLEICWDDRRKMDVSCTRYGRELWGVVVRPGNERAENASQ